MVLLWTFRFSDPKNLRFEDHQIELFSFHIVTFGKISSGLGVQNYPRWLVAFFLYSLFSKISPQSNIPNGNQRDESGDRFVFHIEDFHRGSILARYPHPFEFNLSASHLLP
jgi:hypothetical protein